MARYDNSHSNQQLVTQISMHKFHAACQQGMHAINTIHLQPRLWVADSKSSERQNLSLPSSIKREIMTCDEKGATSATRKSKLFPDALCRNENGQRTNVTINVI